MNTSTSRSSINIPTWRQAALRLLIICGVVLPLLQTSVPPPSEYYELQLDAAVDDLTFNFFLWEIQALFNKLGLEFAAPQDTLAPTERHQLVVDYMDGLRRARALNREITEVYSQFDRASAERKAADLERELSKLRAWLAMRQNMVEGILEEQVSSELIAEGFGRWGFVWPPVKIRFTPLPLLLVTSDRAEITRAGDVHLKAGLPVSDREMLERQVDASFADKRSLVTPIGGLSAYPAMILETDSLIWLTDTFAHEWAHHWLLFHPLGYNYTASSQMTSINETTASIIGREIGHRVIVKYYPDMADALPPLPKPPASPPMTGGEVIWPDEPPANEFDYNREMRQTRLYVEELLQEGQVQEAEAYMEQRRLFFVERGYNIRKLNQAYFAFYGSYATSPSTANPIGGQLEWLRGKSRSLRTFARTVARLSSHQELLDLIERS